MIAEAPFHFLRHGETDWNQRRIMQGWTDTNLSAAGIAQAEAVKAAVDPPQLRQFAAALCYVQSAPWKSSTAA
jgi:broad specificity phosphatase PhoE